MIFSLYSPMLAVDVAFVRVLEGLDVSRQVVAKRSVGFCRRTPAANYSCLRNDSEETRLPPSHRCFSCDESQDSRPRKNRCLFPKRASFGVSVVFQIHLVPALQLIVRRNIHACISKTRPSKKLFEPRIELGTFSVLD